MKSLSYWSLLLILFFSFSCSSNKTNASPAQIERLDEMVKTKQFEIVSDMAYPQVTSAMNAVQNSGLIQPGSTVNQINLIGNVNYLKIKGDSIYAELPYFGERQMNAAYNGSDSSIIIENVAEDYSAVQDETNKSYTITFDAKSNTETIRFIITLFPSFKSSINLNSATRLPIRYSGKVSAL